MNKPRNTDGGSDIRNGDMIEYDSMKRSEVVLFNVNKGLPSTKGSIRRGVAVVMLMVSLRCEDRLISEPEKKFRRCMMIYVGLESE